MGILPFESNCLRVGVALHIGTGGARWTQALKSAGMHLLGMLASLATFWAFTWAVGWIVRGFMGIPQGKDSKE